MTVPIAMYPSDQGRPGREPQTFREDGDNGEGISQPRRDGEST